MQTTTETPGARKRALPSDMQSPPAEGVKRQGVEQELQLRVLCPAPRIGSVIGKGGQVVQALRSDTGARIRVDGTVYGCNERVVVIGSKELDPVQAALLQVLDKIYEEDLVKKDEGGESKAVIRFLVDAVQIGAILGKGGSIIADLRVQSGAQIKVLQGADLPLCALPTDEVVQINGDYKNSITAAQLVVERLKDAPRRPRAQNAHQTPLGMASSVQGGGAGMFSGQGMNQLGMSNASGLVPGMTGMVETTFRLMVPERHTGSIIGKGGEVIRRIREETGAKVIIYDTVEGCDERVLKCRSLEDASSAVCPAQEAMTRALFNLFRNEEHNPGVSLTVRMLVPTEQIGAVLGKKGSIIQGIRRETGSVLIVQPREQLPACSQEGDELFEIRGTMHQIIPAFRSVCTLLRANMMRSQARAAADAMAGGGGVPVNPISSMVQDPNALTMQAGGFGLGVMPRPGLMPGYGTGLPTLPGVDVAAGATLNMVPQLGFGGDGVKITVRLLLTSKQAGAVIGKGGTNIRQINQISAARCKVKESQENGDREMEIYGTAEQAQAAQNLVNAFLMAGNLPTQVRLLVANGGGSSEEQAALDPNTGAMMGAAQMGQSQMGLGQMGAGQMGTAQMTGGQMVSPNTMGGASIANAGLVGQVATAGYVSQMTASVAPQMTATMGGVGTMAGAMGAGGVMYQQQQE
ncbi:hypothetical protein BSKO_06014 [Bryopsis sp. KO-2023]|nr:hypothetical protein BSKO_06014 [Bryopsis sp. KO-2023]